MTDPEKATSADLRDDTPTPLETVVPWGWGSVDLQESDPDCPWTDLGGEE